MPRKIIKYYGANDLGTYIDAKRAFEALDEFNEEKSDYDVNEILSLYNCAQFTKHGVWLKGFTEAEIAKYRGMLGPIEQAVREFFRGLDENNICQALSEVDTEVADDLVELTLKHGLLDRLPRATVLKALGLEGFGMHAILRDKEFVEQCKDEIKADLMTNATHNDIVVYETLYGTKEAHLPKNITEQDRKEAIEKYLESENPNPNYLELIAKNKKWASDKTRLKARKLHEKLVEELMAGRSAASTEFSIEVAISREQKEPVLVTQDGLNTRFSYGKEFLDSVTGPAAVMGFFLDGFGIAGRDSILTLPSYPAETPTLQRVISNLGQRDYLDTDAFRMKLQATIFLFGACVQYLDNRGQSLDAALSWFFSDYLKDEFGAEGFSYQASTSSSYGEKAAHIFSGFDAIKRQFKYYVEDGKIDPELIAISSETPAFSELPSLVPNKYVCLNDSKNNEIARAMHYLYSDQSRLTCTESKATANSFIQLVMNHRVQYGDFYKHQRPLIDWLAARGFLTRNGETLVLDGLRCALLGELYKKEAIVYPYYIDEAKTILDDWQKKGWLKFRSTLLTQAEADFYDFCLTNRTFSNNLALRNMHIHGAKIYEDEDEQWRDYVMALLLMVGLAIKIRFDFGLKLA